MLEIGEENHRSMNDNDDNKWLPVALVLAISMGIFVGLLLLELIQLVVKG